MKLYFRLLSYLTPYWKPFLLAVLCMVLLAAFSVFSLGMIIPFVRVLFSPAQAAPQAMPAVAHWTNLGQVKDLAFWWLLKDGRIAGVYRLCWIILAIFFVKNLFAFLQRALTVYIEQRITVDLRNRMYRHLQQLSLGYFHRNKVGQIVSRLTNDVNIVRAAITEGSLSVIRQGCQALGYAALVVWAAWKLALIALLILPATILAIYLIGRKLRKRGRRLQEKMADVHAVLTETVSGIRVVKTFAAEELEQKKFAAGNREYFRAIFRFETLAGLAPPLTEYLGASAGVAIIWVAKDQIAGAGAITPERFFVFLGAVFSMIQPLNGLSHVNASLQQGLAAAERIFRLLDTKPEVLDKPATPACRNALWRAGTAGAAAVARFDDSLSFERVCFSYHAKPGATNVPDDELALRDIDLNVKQGEMLALVGPSGAGKSTIADLIPRFYDPTSGRILLDGRDLRDLDSKTLRRMMGIVGQETILFHDTVFNNIAYSMPLATQPQVEEAARAANAHDFILEMPHGYQTVIGERGLKMSGGQRQRLSIARAILKNPAILILDEATSALDTQSEILVQEAIDRLMANRTTIVIAHRLS
ncbi:MAG: ABC transporter ATP-binding protein, partial [Candidatus Edwardsbacteria bacterium]|nr:ABC transporter ATP-binding protein [Candidatus Edwardsbacteria bacterium]